MLLDSWFVRCNCNKHSCGDFLEENILILSNHLPLFKFFFSILAAEAYHIWFQQVKG
jgi:hypothetical protein